MDRRRELLNQESTYQEVFDERGVKYIIQFASPNMGYPTGSEMAEMDLLSHVWTLGDKFYKLAHQYYGNAQYWWVIAWFNQTPTESHLVLGQVVRIPLPLDLALRYLRG
jgi:nucleoid-associated protein YgaU